MKYFFIDENIYYKNEKQPPRKVELFNVRRLDDFVQEGKKTIPLYLGYDEDGNDYTIKETELIIEEK